MIIFQLLFYKFPLLLRKMLLTIAQQTIPCRMFLLLQAELTFCTGDIITVFGEIDEDGFYYVSSVLAQTVSTVFTIVSD